MSSLNDLLDPLTRLNVLPTFMNWRGAWGNADQYYKNDVAISPSNGATYILFGKTADAGQDPIGNPAWFELFPHTTGLDSLVAGNGISIAPVPSANNPTISNSGVQSITANSGLFTFGGPNPLVFNTGLLGIVADPSSITGLSWDASSSTLLNAGVLSTFRVGIANSGTAQNQVWSNQGITNLTGSGNVSVAVDASGTATITNTGVVSLAVGAGLTNSGPPTAPTIGLAGSDIATILHPTAPPSSLSIPYTLPIYSYASQPVSLNPNSLLAKQLQTHTASGTNPTWIFDFTPYWFTWNDAPLPLQLNINNVNIAFVDTTTAGGPFVYAVGSAFAGVVALPASYTSPSPLIPNVQPLRANMSFLAISTSDMFDAGLQTINQIWIQNGIGRTAPVDPDYNLTIDAWGDIEARFYPDFVPLLPV